MPLARLGPFARNGRFLYRGRQAAGLVFGDPLVFFVFWLYPHYLQMLIRRQEMLRLREEAGLRVGLMWRRARVRLS
jgi:hypothetical protein